MARSILLIDDEIEILHVLGRFFERRGWRVLRAANGEDGLALQRQQLPDVVLLDLNLPGISGLSVLDVLASHGVPTVLLTAEGDVPTAVEAMRIGAENFLQKPVELQHLEAAVGKAYERGQLKRHNEQLARRLAEGHEPGRLGSSPAMRALARQVELLSASGGTTVLLLGESGTGKGWLAQMIHARGPRSRGPLVEINCAGLSATFLDSELFGHEKGAFTDAKTAKRGLFEVADGGTLFLDEIGELAPDLQPKLLKVLERKAFRRLGGTREIEVDVRLIAATNRDLEADVRAGRFREDLYYRLCVLPLVLPPLRERSRDDLLELIHSLHGQLGAGRSRALGIAPRALDMLLNHAWPGNVRELRNVLERAALLAAGVSEIEPEHLPAELRGAHGNGAAAIAREGFQLRTLEDIERQHIEGALLLLDGNRTRAAETLGISRATLHNKIRRYGLGTRRGN